MRGVASPQENGDRHTTRQERARTEPKLRRWRDSTATSAVEGAIGADRSILRRHRLHSGFYGAWRRCFDAVRAAGCTVPVTANLVEMLATSLNRPHRGPRQLPPLASDPAVTSNLVVDQAGDDVGAIAASCFTGASWQYGF